ncbi:MAG: hypothetical protein ACYTF8_12955 [Planctomycetota bacterium]|jgi:hypothetical protein
MGMRSVPALLLLALLAVAGCGNGTLADVFAIFPKEAFEGDDDIPGDGEIPLPFFPKEIDALAGGQGVTGDVRNIALATISGFTYAFLAAGTDGIHVADVTLPDLINTESYVVNVRNGANGASIAGGAVHDLTVVDNRFLVCLSVGTGATNAVTVFDLDLLIPAVVANPAADVSTTIIPPAPATAIAVPGAGGKGGGVSGSTANFVVATGTGLIAAVITATAPAAWALSPAQPDFGTTNPATITDVLVNGTTAVYATGTNGTGNFGLFVLAHPALPIPSTPTFGAVDGNFQTVVDNFVTGPGTYPLDLASNGLNLYVSGVDEVLVYGITNPLGPALLSTVRMTGPETIAVAAEGVTFTVGADNALAIGSNVVGQASLVGEVSFPGTFTVRGVAMSTTDAGSFAFCCAGTSGMRVVQLTESQR